MYGGRNSEEFRWRDCFERSLVSLGKIVTKFPSFRRFEMVLFRGARLEIRRGNKERPTSSKGINGFLARNALIKYRRDISARLASPAGI